MHFFRNADNLYRTVYYSSEHFSEHYVLSTQVWCQLTYIADAIINCGDVKVLLRGRRRKNCANVSKKLLQKQHESVI